MKTITAKITINTLFIITIVINYSYPLISQNPRIFYGEDISISDAPWIVNFEDENGSIGCGVIINNQWILTAAHVVGYWSQSTFLDFYVHAGSTNFTESGTGQRIKVIQRILNPNWDPDRISNPHNYDLALVKLSEPLCFNKDVQAILLANETNTSSQIIAPGNVVKIAGWGNSENYSQGGSPILQGAELTIIDNEDANYLIHEVCNTFGHDNFGYTYICMDDINGDIVVGAGDSGGPVYDNLQDGTPILLGINIISIGECGGYLSLAMNIRPFYYWIQENITPGICECHEDVYIESTTTYNNDMLFEGNLIVQTGTQLTVTSKLEFKQTHGIIIERGAKLIVDGGILTKASSEDHWKGINVEGNFDISQPSSINSTPTSNQCGIVVIKNNSTVDWARTAISSSKICEHWNSEYWGGLIHCENSEFNNCGRVAEFMKYDHLNKSAFINCEINDGKYGITIWDTDGININNCDFTNLTETGVIVWDAGCKIFNGCSFISNKRGVESFATSPISSGGTLIIEKTGQNINEFSNNEVMDIDIKSGELYKNARIMGNEFNGSGDGIWLDGLNSINILGNTFTDMDFSIVGQNTGFGFNIFQCNSMSDNIAGSIILEGINQRTRFLKNIFESEIVDINLSEAEDGTYGSIHPFQGTPNSPAKNCFSFNHSEHIWTLNNTHSFNYFVPLNPNECDEPEEGNFGPNTNNYVVYFIGQNSLVDCNIIPGEPEASYDYSDYSEIYDDYQTKSNQYNSSPTNLTYLRELLDLEETKEMIVGWFIRDAIANQDDSLAQVILNRENNLNADRLSFSLKVQLYDYSAAETILNSLPNSTQDDQWFKLVQEINLERLSRLDTFNLSTIQDSILQIVANSNSKERGYARSILSLLKDTHFSPDFNPPSRQLPTNVISNNDNNKSLLIIPNPTINNFEISLPTFVGDNSILRIMGIDGIEYKKVSLKQGDKFEISVIGFPPGMYFLQIFEKETQLYNSKLVISR